MDSLIPIQEIDLATTLTKYTNLFNLRIGSRMTQVLLLTHRFSQMTSKPTRDIFLSPDKVLELSMWVFFPHISCSLQRVIA
jgi:hypothetical protein